MWTIHQVGGGTDPVAQQSLGLCRLMLWRGLFPVSLYIYALRRHGPLCAMHRIRRVSVLPR